MEAAHIRPYEEGGEHRIANGLLLRSDLHTLFDKGYVTVTPEHRMEVSRRLETEFDNGKEYLALHGRAIGLPREAGDRPAREFLEWHNENRFVALGTGGSLRATARASASLGEGQSEHEERGDARADSGRETGRERLSSRARLSRS
ncbi:MAG: HNH endonuclease [Acidobacteria bacterium]|nr:HNH endonuclease [Acidobacteriota bacterium]